MRPIGIIPIITSSEFSLASRSRSRPVRKTRRVWSGSISWLTATAYMARPHRERCRSHKDAGGEAARRMPRCRPPVRADAFESASVSRLSYRGSSSPQSKATSRGERAVPACDLQWTIDLFGHRKRESEMACYQSRRAGSNLATCSFCGASDDALKSFLLCTLLCRRFRSRTDNAVTPVARTGVGDCVNEFASRIRHLKPT